MIKCWFVFIPSVANMTQKNSTYHKSPIPIFSTVYNYYITTQYRKIPRISPWAYIFQRPFLRGLFLEGLIFGGAYIRREICVSKLIQIALFLEGNLLFSLVLPCICGHFPITSPRGALNLEGRFNRGNSLGGLYMEEPIFGILQYVILFSEYEYYKHL